MNYYFSKILRCDFDAAVTKVTEENELMVN